MAEAAVKVPDPAPEPAPAPAQDDFSAAFAQLTEPEPAKTDPEPAKTPAAGGSPAAEPQPGAAAEPAGGETEDDGLPPTPVEEEAARKAAEAAAKPAPAAAPTVTDDDLLKRLGTLLGREPAAPARQEPEPQQPTGPQLSEEETALVEAYFKEFPDVARAEAVIRREEAKQIVAYTFAQIGAYLKPLIEQVGILAQRTHLGDLQTQVPDYPNKRQAVIDWVGKQPAYLKAAYEHVVKAGSAEEVADLIARYDRENPSQAAPAAAPARAPNGSAGAPSPAPAAPTPAQAAIKKAAAALAPVGSKRSTVVVPDDPADFDAAFAKFAQNL